MTLTWRSVSSANGMVQASREVHVPLSVVELAPGQAHVAERRMHPRIVRVQRPDRHRASRHHPVREAGEGRVVGLRNASCDPLWTRPPRRGCAGLPRGLPDAPPDRPHGHHVPIRFVISDVAFYRVTERKEGTILSVARTTLQPGSTVVRERAAYVIRPWCRAVDVIAKDSRDVVEGVDGIGGRLRERLSSKTVLRAAA
jgi:hypothetical protein